MCKSNPRARFVRKFSPSSEVRFTRIFFRCHDDACHDVTTLSFFDFEILIFQNLILKISQNLIFFRIWFWTPNLDIHWIMSLKCMIFHDFHQSLRGHISVTTDPFATNKVSAAIYSSSSAKCATQIRNRKCLHCSKLLIGYEVTVISRISRLTSLARSEAAT